MKPRRAACITRVTLLFVFIAVTTTAPGDTHNAAGIGLLVATGNYGGIYHPVGNSVCRLLNLETERHGLRCFARISTGSVANLRALRAGEVSFGLVQSDVEHAAATGEAPFSRSGPLADLRVVLELHEEPFTVLARRDSGIRNHRQLLGKRISVGELGSGDRFTGKKLLEAYGWDRDDFESVVALSPFDRVAALCNGEVDAIEFRVGHPNGWVQEAARLCDVTLVGVEGAELDRLLAETAYYSRAVIPGGLYRANREDVPSFGARALLVTRAGEPELVYELTRAVMENFDIFVKLHPALARLTREAMVPRDMATPLHAGARRYFEEAGLLSRTDAARVISSVIDPNGPNSATALSPSSTQ